MVLCIASLLVSSLFASMASGLTLKDSPKEPVGFFYLRNPKAGSTSALFMLNEARKTHKRQCEHVKVASSRHDKSTVAVIEKAIPGVRTFTILREPCERFMSQWAHLHGYVESGSDWKKTPCNVHGDEHSKLMKALQTPWSFAKALQKSPTLREMFLAPEPMKFFQRCLMSALGYKQSNFVSGNTSVACLPTMWNDLKHILHSNVNTRDCVLPPEVDENMNNVTEPDRDLCKLVKDIYSEDVKLWNEHCAHRQK